MSADQNPFSREFRFVRPVAMGWPHRYDAAQATELDGLKRPQPNFRGPTGCDPLLKAHFFAGTAVPLLLRHIAREAQTSQLVSMGFVLSPGYDFVATLPYIPNDSLGLTFGDSRSLSEITIDQVRRFADTARLPVSPLWPMVVDVTDRTVAAWEKLGEKDLLPKKMRKTIGDQIMMVAKSVGEAGRK